jgi:hypothetical protein
MDIPTGEYLRYKHSDTPSHYAQQKDQQRSPLQVSDNLLPGMAHSISSRIFETSEGDSFGLAGPRSRPSRGCLDGRQAVNSIPGA